MKEILALTMASLFSAISFADVWCGPDYGPKKDLSDQIKVVTHDYDMYEVYFPTKYKDQELDMVAAVLEKEGKQGYFYLSHEKKNGIYYVHVGIEPLKSEVTITGMYGSGECVYEGRAQLKRNKANQQGPSAGAR